jgi:hypothetical protein
VTCYEVGGTVFVGADVAGKGLSSALVGTSFRAALRALAHSGISLLDLATRMNRLHYDEGPAAQRRYVTTFLARLSPATNNSRCGQCGAQPDASRNGRRRGPSHRIFRDTGRNFSRIRVRVGAVCSEQWFPAVDLHRRSE